MMAGKRRVFREGGQRLWLPSQENTRLFSGKTDCPSVARGGSKSLHTNLLRFREEEPRFCFHFFGQSTAPPRTEGFVNVDAAIQLVGSRF
jgi:hypothetical protein